MEPERAIEKALRTFADQRRKAMGEDPQLHPATRRILQAEVAARYRPPPSRTLSWWPRLAWSFGALAVAVALIVVLNRPDPATPMQMAKSDPVAANRQPLPPGGAPYQDQDRLDALEKSATSADRMAPPAPTAENAPAPASAPARALASTPVPQQPAGSAEALAAPSPTRNREAVPQETFARRFNSGLDKAAAAKPPATSAPTLAADSKSASTLEAGAITAAIPESDTRLPFGATGSISTNAVVAPVVLSSFSVEHEGTTLRITDADGSIYTGFLAQADAPVSGTTGSPTTRSTSFGGGFGGSSRGTATTRYSETTALYSFQVKGTNKTLLQPVSFTGNFQAKTQRPGALRFTNIYDLTLKAKTEPSQAPSQEINGQLKLGSAPERPIKAVPAAPK